MYDTNKLNKIVKSKGLLGVSVQEGGVIVKRMSLPVVSAGLSTSARAETNTLPLEKGLIFKGSPKGADIKDLLKQRGVPDEMMDRIKIKVLRSASMNVDRTQDKFASAALTDMAEKSPGTPIQADHNWSVWESIGMTLTAGVANSSGSKRLVQVAMFLIDEKSKVLIDRMDATIIDKVSVSFSMDLNDYVCNSCNRPIVSRDCSHYPGGMDEKGNIVTMTIKRVKDYFETSLVGVPAQADARIGDKEYQFIQEESKTFKQFMEYFNLVQPNKVVPK